MTPDELIKIQREDALKAHESHNKNFADTFNMVAGFSNAAMKAPAIAAAGGIAALLGFFSANAVRVQATSEAIISFNFALAWFFASVFCCVLAPSGAYLSQGLFVWSLGAKTQHWEHPFVRETKKSRLFSRIGICIQIATIFLVLLSMAFLLAGVTRFVALAALVVQSI